MTFVELSENCSVRCTIIGHNYLYELKEGEDGEPLPIGSHTKSPRELSSSTQIGRDILNEIKDRFSNRELKDKSAKTRYRELMSALQEDVNKQSIANENKAKEEVKELEEEYEENWANFEYNRKKMGLSRLQYIICVFEGLGVDASLEMAKAYIGYLQTFLGLKGTNVIGVGSQSSGKALSLDTKIPTPTGFTLMKDLKVGDEVFDENGKICNVLFKSEVFYDHDCYKITFENGSSIICDAEHQWKVQENRQRRKGCKQSYSVLTTEEMFNHMEYIQKHWKYPNTFSYTIDTCRTLQLPVKQLPIEPYLLGLWLGDGDSNASYITTVDEEILSAFEQEGYGISQHNSYKIRYGITGGFWKLLRVNNLLGNKHIPREYLRGSYEQRLSLLQGIMDTDGTVDKAGYCEITQKNYRFACEIKELLWSIGIKCNINKIFKFASNTDEKIKHPYYRLHFTTNQKVFRLKRKLNRLPLELKSPMLLRRNIRSIERVDSVPTQCISVDSDSHLYLASEEFVPTHNTHILENPLDCIPSEFVHKGTFSRSYFFRKFGGKNLDSHIFYLQDLGGDMDDQNTIESRDVLKQLSTDGFASKGIVDEEGDTTDMIVTGHPAIAYTTVSEDIINEQERSRSIVIRPPDVNQRKLMIFDSFDEASGVKYELKEKIQEDKRDIQGFSWWLKKNIKDIEMFNPFMFCVQRFLSQMDDFNRKIKEFNMFLKVICILNDSFKMEHDLYDDFEEDDFNINTTLLIPSKQDIIDALTLFEGSTGLFPSEIALAKGILKIYKEFPSELLKDVEDEDATYEDIVIESAIDDDVIVTEHDEVTGKYYLEGFHNGYIDDEGNTVYCFFTIDSLKKGNSNQRWYRENRNDMSDKLYKLYNYGILIKIGYDKKGRNVYGVSNNADNRINNTNPKFLKKDVDLAKDIFHERYPALSDEFDLFVNKQMNLNVKHTNFEIRSHLYELEWNHYDVEE